MFDRFLLSLAVATDKINIFSTFISNDNTEMTSSANSCSC